MSVSVYVRSCVYVFLCVYFEHLIEFLSKTDILALVHIIMYDGSKGSEIQRQFVAL